MKRSGHCHVDILPHIAILGLLMAVGLMLREHGYYWSGVAVFVGSWLFFITLVWAYGSAQRTWYKEFNASIRASREERQQQEQEHNDFYRRETR